MLLVMVTGAGLLGCADSADRLAEVRAQQNAGDYEGSVEPLRQLLAEKPGDPELLYLYGVALMRSGQYSPGEWPLREAMEDPEWRVPAAMQLATASLRVGNPETSIEAATDVLEVEPENVSALMIRAQAYAATRYHQNWENALADVEKVLELDPDNTDALRPRILAYLNLNRVDEAEAALESLGEKIDEGSFPEDTQAWYCATMALFAAESGEDELADSRFSDCLERFPDNQNVISNAISIYDERHDFARSLEILRNAVEAVPNSRGYRSALAQRLRLAGQTEEAEKVLREATEVPNPAAAVAAWLELAEHYQALGEYAKGVEATDRAVELAKSVGIDQPQLALEHADALLLAGELDRAEEVAQQMTLEAHRELILARVEQERGHYDKSLAHFDVALKLWPDNAAARAEAARAALSKGDFDRAIEEYRSAIRIEPTATDARTQMGTMLAAENRPREALQMLRSRQGAPLVLEGELLSLRLWALLGQVTALQNGLTRFANEDPRHLPAAFVSAAEGLRERSDAEAALRVLLDTKLDYQDERNADVLRALVRYGNEAGKFDEEVKPLLDGAVAAHPDSAALQETRAFSLELRGAPGEKVRAAYERALELEPDNARALAGLAREALERDPERALTFFDRAAAADPSDVEAKHGAARALLAMGRREEAEGRLEKLLEVHPYEGDVAAELVELQLERGPATEQTLALARRAVRFGGGAGELDLLSRVYAQRGDSERATRAAEAAKRIREGQAPEPAATSPGTS